MVKNKVLFISNSNRNMNSFIKNLLLFLFILFITISGLELYIRTIPNSYKYKFKWMELNCEEVEVLILGSSHTYFGIKPNLLNRKAFNLALPAQHFEQDYCLLSKWGNRCKNLKTVICPISYFSFFIKNRDWPTPQLYTIYMDCKIYPSTLKHNFEFFYPKYAISKIFGKQDLQCDSLGWYSPKDHNGMKPDASVLLKKQNTKNEKEIQMNIRDFELIADFCKSHKFQLVLITTPCMETYYSKLDKTQKNRMYDIIKEMTKKYDVKYLDYMCDNRFCNEDFIDGDHLSTQGAEKITKILKNDIFGQ